MKRLKKLWILPVVCALVACRASGLVPLLQQEVARVQIQRLEADSEKHFASLTYDQVSGEELSSLRSSLQGDPSVGVGVFTLNDGFVGVSDLEANVIFPLIQMEGAQYQDLIQTLGGAANVSQSQSTVAWVELFHWVNHMSSDMGIPVTHLQEFGAHLSVVARGAYSGDGIILYRPGTDTLQEAYMMVARVKGQPWVGLFASDGAPITSYNTGTGLGSYIDRMSLRGFREVSSDAVPREIRENWVEGTAPTLRMWFWALKYQVAKYAAVAQAAAASAGVAVKVGASAYWADMLALGSSETFVFVFILPPDLLYLICPYLAPSEPIIGEVSIPTEVTS